MIDRESVVAGLKSAASSAWFLPIVHSSTGLIGVLRPITYELAGDASVLDALYRWRQAHMQAFLTRFTPSLDSTSKYLLSYSLPDSKRILFLIDDLTGRHVGHIGLCNITAASVELDNVVRGEPVDIPTFMVSAQTALLRWVFSQLDVPLAYLNVLQDNKRAIRSYSKTGFVPKARMPLGREETEGGHRLVPLSESVRGAPVGFLVRMELARESFGKEFSTQG
jgi:RimJ/RimL family protein N-acetyltransferase